MSGYRRVINQTWWIFLAMLICAIAFSVILHPVVGFAVFVVSVGVYIYFVLVRGSGAGGER